MTPSFKYSIFFIFILLCGFCNIAYSHGASIALHQAPSNVSQLAKFNVSNGKAIIPARLAKKEYWRPRGTNNEDEDEDDKFHLLKKDKKQRHATGIIHGYW